MLLAGDPVLASSTDSHRHLAISRALRRGLARVVPAGVPPLCLRLLRGPPVFGLPRAELQIRGLRPARKAVRRRRHSRSKPPMPSLPAALPQGLRSSAGGLPSLLCLSPSRRDLPARLVYVR